MCQQRTHAPQQIRAIMQHLRAAFSISVLSLPIWDHLGVPGALTLDGSDLMLQAAMAGEGLVYLSDFATADKSAGDQSYRTRSSRPPG
jgi:hypothetical protein